MTLMLGSNLRFAGDWNISVTRKEAALLWFPVGSRIGNRWKNKHVSTIEVRCGNLSLKIKLKIRVKVSILAYNYYIWTEFSGTTSPIVMVCSTIASLQRTIQTQWKDSLNIYNRWLYIVLSNSPLKKPSKPSSLYFHETWPSFYATNFFLLRLEKNYNSSIFHNLRNVIM